MLYMVSIQLYSHHKQYIAGIFAILRVILILNIDYSMIFDFKSNETIKKHMFVHRKKVI